MQYSVTERLTAHGPFIHRGETPGRRSKMAGSTRRQLVAGITSIAVGAALLVSFPADGVGQGIPCDASLAPPLELPEVLTSATRAPLREEPSRDANVVVTLPPDIRVDLLDESDGWFAVRYRDRDRHRRLYVSARDAEGPSRASLEPRQVAAQEWAAAHTRACERIAGERFVARSLAAATVVAGLTSIIWHVYVDDDDHYGTAFGIWTGVSVASLMGTVYKAFVLSRAKRELRDLGPPSFTGAGTLPRLVRLGGELRFDARMRRIELVAAWHP